MVKVQRWPRSLCMLVLGWALEAAESRQVESWDGMSAALFGVAPRRAGVLFEFLIERRSSDGCDDGRGFSSLFLTGGMDVRWMDPDDKIQGVM